MPIRQYAGTAGIAVATEKHMNLEPSLKEGLKRFRRLSKKTRKDPTADNVHDLRVVTRKLRADFWILPKSHRTDAIRKIRRHLKDLGETLGEQRKYDVALEDAIHYGGKTRKIETHLEKARKDVIDILRARTRKRIAWELARAIRDTRHISSPSLTPSIERLRRDLLKAVSRSPNSNAARHHLRIRIKRARYVLEAFHHDVPKLNELQEHLGRWHDLTVLTGMAGQPKGLFAARNGEWKLAQRALEPTLLQTSKALIAIERELG